MEEFRRDTEQRKQVPKTQSLTKDEQTPTKRHLTSDHHSAPFGQFQTPFMCSLSVHRNQQNGIILLNDALSIKWLISFQYLCPSQFLSLIFSIPIYSVKYNLVLSLGFTMHMFVLHVLSLVLGAHLGYLHSDAGHQLFRCKAFMMDFYLIAF